MVSMRAFVRISSQSDTVELSEVAVPGINENEVLVKVRAFGVGVQDRSFIPPNAEFPYPIGIEAAGIVEKVGSNVTGFQTGDSVILTSSFQPKGGCYAEYVAVPFTMLGHMPDEMDFNLGAAIPVAGKAALEALHGLDLNEGDTLFVAGASGAIGTLVIQLVRNAGVRVAGSASSKNDEYMLSLGAEKAVDYTAPNWKSDLRAWMPDGVDAALAIQPGTTGDSMDVVKDGGKVITVFGDSVEPQRGITVQVLQHQLDMQDAIGNLAAAITTGRIRLVIEREYPFDHALEALEKVETRHARGKIIVSV